MPGRISTMMMYGSLTGTLQKNMRNLLDLERQMATQNKYARLSDNPSEIARALALQSSITSGEKRVATLENSVSMLKYSETALDTAIDILHDIRTLVVNAGDGGLDATAVDAIATQIEALKDELLDTLNAKIAGKYLFGGTDTTTKPFILDANGQVRYVGSDERIRYEVEQSLLGDVSFTGSDVVPENNKSYFVCSHYVPTDWKWTGREEKVQITVGNRTLSLFIPESWIDELSTGGAPTDYNEFRDPEELDGISLDNVATLVNRALTEQGVDMLVKATVEKNYDAGQQRLIFKSTTGEPISVTGWPTTDYMPMPQSVAGLEMGDTSGSYWNQTQLAGSAEVDFSGLSAKSLQVYVNGGTPVSVNLTGVTDMAGLLTQLNTALPPGVTAVEQDGKIALISANGDSLRLDGTAVEAIFGGVRASEPPGYSGLMGTLNTLGWRNDGLGRQINITAGGVTETFKLDDYKNITDLVQAINEKMPVGPDDLPFASIVAGRLTLQSTKGGIEVEDSGTSGGTMQLFGYDGDTASGGAPLKSSTSSLSIKLGDAEPIKIYINEDDDLAQIAERISAIEGIYARTSADGSQLVVVAQRTGDLPEDPLAVDVAQEKLHYPSFVIECEGMALSLFDGTCSVDPDTGVETRTLASEEQTRPIDHSHIDLFDYLGMETALKSVEFEQGETLKVEPGKELHWRVISGSHVVDVKLGPGEYTMEQLADRLKNAGAGWLEVTVDAFRAPGEPGLDDAETGLGTSLNGEEATGRLVIRSTAGSPVVFMDMNDERYAEEMGLSMALRTDESTGMDEIVLPTAPCVDRNLAAMVRVQKTCGMAFDVRLARKDIMNPDGETVDRVRVMKQIAAQVNAQAGYDMLKVIIPVDGTGNEIDGSASLVSVTGEPFEVVDLPFLDPTWSGSYTPGIAAQMGIHGGVTSLPAMRDDDKIVDPGTIRFESLGRVVEIDVVAGDTVKTIMDRLRVQAGDWLYVNYFDANMGNLAGQEGDTPIIAIAARDGSAVNVIDVKGSVAQDALLLNTSIQGDLDLTDPAAWQIPLPLAPSEQPQTFSITVAGYTHTIDLTAMRDMDGNGALDAGDLVETINARMQDYDVRAELNDDGHLVLWSPRGYSIEVNAQIFNTATDSWDDNTAAFLGTGASSTPYRGGYGLEGSNTAPRTGPGIYTQNVTARGGANQSQQSFFGVLDDIAAAVRSENRDGLSDKLLPIIDGFLDSLLRVQSTNGALQARYTGNIGRLESNGITMTEAYDSAAKIDIYEITTELMAAQVIYQASLGIISYIVQPTLLDFLR